MTREAELRKEIARLEDNGINDESRIIYYKELKAELKGITETNAKWLQAVQKLKEEFKDTGVEDFIDKIFGELTQ